jgi:hypothetical protein
VTLPVAAAATGIESTTPTAAAMTVVVSPTHSDRASVRLILATLTLPSVAR